MPGTLLSEESRFVSLTKLAVRDLSYYGCRAAQYPAPKGDAIKIYAIE